MADFVNTRTTLGEQATLDGLVGHTLETFNEDGLASLGQYAMYHNTGLVKVNMPAVTSGGQYAFQNCSNLENASFERMTSLANYMFRDCSSLTSITIPKVTSISQYSLGGCKKLKILDLTNTSKPTISANAFNGSGLLHLVIRSTTAATLSNVSAFTGTPIKNGIGGIYVPADLVSTYKGASNWSTFADIIYPISEYPKTEFGTISDSWAEIFAAEDDGSYVNKYNVGDTKSIMVGDDIVMMQIAAINGDTLTAGGTAKITWLCKEIYAKHNMNSTDTTNGGWPSTAMRTYLTTEIYNNIISSVKSRIVQVSKTYYDYSSSTTKTSDDYIWIPSTREVCFTGSNIKESSGVQYSDLFTNDASRVKHDSSGSANNWWLRSANNSTYFYYVVSGGGNYYANASNSNGVVFGFCT